MFIAKRHIRERFSPIRKQRFAFDGPFAATVLFTLLEPLPYKIAGRHRYRKRNVGEIRRRRKRKCPSRRRARDADFFVSVILQPFYRFFYSFQRIIMMAVILFRRRHRKHVYTIFHQPLRATLRHIIFRVVAQHSDNRSVCLFFILPIRAVKAVIRDVEMNVFHTFLLKSILTICIFIKPSPHFARNLKKPLTDGSRRSL